MSDSVGIDPSAAPSGTGCAECLAGEGLALADTTSHPVEQPVPGPAGAVPEDWQQHLK